MPIVVPKNNRVPSYFYLAMPGMPVVCLTMIEYLALPVARLKDSNVTNSRDRALRWAEKDGSNIVPFDMELLR
ncbi:hypothetical protein LCGC14_0319680 [marine sediment metagenome]|uniref:Uncharacterized protein n=1 Tax=marine sediment metagenome TaxID=412755 RepID=A0A0F9TJH8_9ZZZZ